MTTVLTPAFQNPDHRLITDVEVEALLGVARGWAAKDRVGKARIPFVKIGRSVRYRRSDVETFIAANMRRSTSDAARAQ